MLSQLRSLELIVDMTSLCLTYETEISQLNSEDLGLLEIRNSKVKVFVYVLH